MGRHIGATPASPTRGTHASPLKYVAAATGTLALLAGTVAGVAQLTSAANAQTFTKTLTLKPTDDTYAQQGSPTRTNGNDPRLTAGSLSADNKVIFLKFKVSGLPTNLDSLEASVTMTRDLHHLPADTVSLKSVADTTWTEAALNWNNKPAVGSEVDSATNDSTTKSDTFNVSKSVTKDGTYSFAVTSPTTTDVARFQSSETSSSPVLTIKYSYTVADPTPSPAQTTASPSPTATQTTTPSPSPTPTTSSTPVTSGGACAPNAILVPSCGIYWGAAPGPFTGLTPQVALQGFEQTIGRPVDIFHYYHSSPELFPTAWEKQIAMGEPGKHRMLLLNWKPEMGRTWAQVAAGDPTVDGQIDKLAAYINTNFPYKFFLTIHHEPENEVVETAGSGMTAADYRAMFRHVALRLRADGVDNAIIVETFMAWDGWGTQSWFNDLYAGDDVVQWIAGDPYIKADPTVGYKTKDFATLVNHPSGSWPGFYTWATSLHPGKPLMLAEWGVFEYPTDPSLKAKILSTVGQQIGQFPAIKAMVYFNSPNAPKGDTRVDSSSLSLPVYQGLGGTTLFDSVAAAY